MKLTIAQYRCYSRTSTGALASNGNKDSVLYFAYGANMSRRILQSRGVQPLSAEPAIATCASLAFRHVGGYATLVPLTSTALQQLSSLEHAAPHGVLLRLSSLDFAKLVAFEGGYNVRGVTVETYDGRWEAAQAFSSQALVLLRASLPPMERYAAIMRAGAREQGLCSVYCAWLDAVPTVPPYRIGVEYFATSAEVLARGVAAGIAAVAMAAVLRPRA